MIFFSQVKEVSQDRDLLFTEIRAGVTTFLTMAYILFVNVSILSQAITFDGAPEQIFTTTALAAGFGSPVCIHSSSCLGCSLALFIVYLSVSVYLLFSLRSFLLSLSLFRFHPSPFKQ